MFGFLPGPCGCSSRDDHSAWRSHFCGLCNTLRSRYGLWSRWLINRDSTFLALTGSALSLRELETTRTTCCNPLGKKRPLVQHHPQMQYAAAVTICGLAVKLRDDAGDERGLRRRAAGAGSWLLRRAELKARADLAAAGFPVSAVAGTIGGQNAAETAGASLTAAVEPTARTYGAIFGHMAGLSGTPAGTAALTDAGAALGRMIYTVDAWEDYDSDLRRRRFNPLPPSASSRRDMVTEAVDRDLNLLTRALTALPLVRYGSLIQTLAGPMLRRRTLTRLGMAGPPPLPPEMPPPPSDPHAPPRDQPFSSREERPGEKKTCGCCEGSCGCCDKCCRGGSSGKRRRGNRDRGCWGTDACCYCDCPGCDCGGCDCPCDCG
jgi:hypothetical protein